MIGGNHYFALKVNDYAQLPAYSSYKWNYRLFLVCCNWLSNAYPALHLYITIYNKSQSFNIKGILINKRIIIFIMSLNRSKLKLRSGCVL